MLDNKHPISNDYLVLEFTTPIKAHFLSQTPFHPVLAYTPALPGLGQSQPRLALVTQLVRPHKTYLENI